MKDMTKGSPAKLILFFTIPLFLGNVVQQFYNLADMKLVGYYLGTDMFAAVGAATPIAHLFISLLNGMCSGFSLMIAKFFGANDENGTKHSIAACMILSAFTAIMLTVLGVLFAEPVLRFLNTPEQILKPACEYLTIIFAGMTFTVMYNMCAGILRAFGNSKIPLYFLILSAMFNIGLDIVFIKYLHFGVKGAALATVIAQSLAGILCFIYMMVHCPEVRVKRAHFAVPVKLLVDMYAQGLSMGFMFAIVNFGTVFLQSAINGFGTDIIAAHTAARKISDVYMMPLSSFGVGAATFASQNYGAGKYDRIKKGVFETLLMTFVWSALVVVVTYLFARPIITMMASTTEPAIVDTAVRYLRWDTPFYCVLCIVLVVRNVLQGLNVKIMTLFSSVLELIGKVVVVLVFAPKIGYFAVILSEPLIWIVMMFWLILTFFVNWKKIVANGPKVA